MANHLTDTRRLDAIGEHGLCLVQRAEYTSGEWQIAWECHYLGGIVVRPTIREAIDDAVLDITAPEGPPN